MSNNLQFTILSPNQAPLVNRRVVVYPYSVPQIDNNKLVTGDKFTYYTDDNGNLTGSIAQGTYTCQIENPVHPTLFYISASSISCSLISGSIVTGSKQDVIIDLETLNLNNFTSTVNLVGLFEYPYTFSGSLYTQNSTKLTLTNGGTTQSLNPGIYQLECLGSPNSSIYFNIPQTASLGTINAKDYLINKPTGNIIVPQIGYVSQVDSASYAQSSSYSNFASNANSSSYAVSSSYSYSGSYAFSSDNTITSSYTYRTIVNVKNGSSDLLPANSVVRISGANGANLLVDYASWNNDYLSADTIGFVLTDIDYNGFGTIITQGTLINADTSNFNAGDLLFLSGSGQYTNVRPTAPLHTVRLGYVVRANKNNGVIFVKVDNGYELGELHDVVDSTTTSSYGDLLIKSGSVWKNSKNLTGSYVLSGSLTTNDGISCNDITASNKIIYKNAVLLDYNNVTTANTISVVLTNATSSYNSAFFDYYANSGSNIRGGNVVSVWNNGNLEYTETCTVDVGTTSNLALYPRINGSNIEFVASSSVINYKIKVNGRYL